MGHVCLLCYIFFFFAVSKFDFFSEAEWLIWYVCKQVAVSVWCHLIYLMLLCSSCMLACLVWCKLLSLKHNSDVLYKECEIRCWYSWKDRRKVFLATLFVFMLLLTASVYYLSPLRFGKIFQHYWTFSCRLEFTVRGVQLASWVLVTVLMMTRNYAFRNVVAVCIVTLFTVYF